MLKNIFKNIVRFFLKFNLGARVSLILILVVIFAQTVLSIYNFAIFNLVKNEIPSLPRVQKMEFMGQYDNRYYFDKYLDLFFYEDLGNFDFNKFVVKISEEEFEIEPLDKNIIRVNFKSEFQKQVDRRIQVYYESKLIYDKTYFNDGLTEEEENYFTPRSLTE
jgi:ABC-type multidrug transport system fused ATPase/permease subunit